MVLRLQRSSGDGPSILKVSLQSESRKEPSLASVKRGNHQPSLPRDYILPCSRQSQTHVDIQTGFLLAPLAAPLACAAVEGRSSTTLRPQGQRQQMHPRQTAQKHRQGHTNKHLKALLSIKPIIPQSTWTKSTSHAPTRRWSRKKLSGWSGSNS